MKHFLKFFLRLKKRSALLPVFALLFFSALSQGTSFGYDQSGNRQSRTIVLPPPPLAAPVDTSFLAEEHVQPPEKVHTDKLNESDVLIYPNPTQGALAVEIRNKDPKVPHHLTVYTIQGATVFQRSNIGDYIQIDLSSQPKGVYLLRIFTQDSFITWRIIKQ